MHSHRLRCEANAADQRPTSSPLVAGQHDALRRRVQFAVGRRRAATATDGAARTEATVIVVVVVAVMVPMRMMGARAAAAPVLVLMVIRVGAPDGRLEGGRVAGRAGAAGAAAAGRRLAQPVRLGHSLAAQIVVEVAAEHAGHAVQCDRIDARVEEAEGALERNGDGGVSRMERVYFSRANNCK